MLGHPKSVKAKVFRILFFVETIAPKSYSNNDTRNPDSPSDANYKGHANHEVLFSLAL